MSTLSGFLPARPHLFGTQLRPQSEGEYWGRRLAILVLLVWVVGAAFGFQSSLQVLNLLGFAIAAVGILKPPVGLLGVGILCTLDALSRVFLMRDGLWRYNSFNYLLLFMVIVALPIAVKLADTHTRTLQVFVIVLLLGLFISPDRRLGMVHTMNVVGTMGILAYFLRTRLDVTVLLWAGIVNGLLAGIGGGLFYYHMSRLPYINPNAWVFFPLTALFSISIGLRFARNQSYEQVLLMLLASVNVAWVFLSGSRGGMFIGACCVASIMYSSFHHSRRGGSIMAIGAVTGLVCAGIALASFSSLRTHALGRLTKLFDSSLSMDSRTSGRSDLLVAGWYMFLDNPLGIGTGGFAPEFAKQDFDFASDKDLQAHSAWIKTLAENGILGITVLSAYVFSFAAAGWRKRNQGFFQVGLLVTVAFTVAFTTTEFQNKGLWFFAGAATSLLHYSPRPVRRVAFPVESRDV